MRRLVLIGLLGMAYLAPLSAETLLIEAVRSPDGGPANGTSMEAVQARLGTPEHRFGPVGEPPITRWEYPEITVYFEADRVIHSVARPLREDS